MASYFVYRVSEKHQVRNFRLPGSAWGLYIKVEHFHINIFWISKRNMEKYRTAGRLIILSVVTSLQELERQRHWQFALQFLFTALHGQQPRPLFRAQVPLHGQETSTDLVLLNKDGKLQLKKLMNEWKRGGSTFLPSKCTQGFSRFSLATTNP